MTTQPPIDYVGKVPYAVIDAETSPGGFGQLRMDLWMPSLMGTSMASVRLRLQAQCDNQGNANNGDPFYTVRFEAFANYGGLSLDNLERTRKTMLDIQRTLDRMDRAAKFKAASFQETMLRYIAAAKVELALVAPEVDTPRLINHQPHWFTDGHIPDGLVPAIGELRKKLLVKVGSPLVGA